LAAPLIAPLFYYRARLLKKAVRSIDAFLAPTAFVRDIFLKEGIPQDKIHQMELGVHLSEGGRIERKEGGPLRISYIGNLAWQKGVHILIQAFSRLDQDRAILNIYGGEDTFPRYAQKLHLLARGLSVHFMGPLPRERLWLALAETDLLVIPSLWYETFSLVALEAFAAGVPVVASRLGALTERIDHGQDGFLFRPGDPDDLARYLQLLMNEPTTLERLRRNVRPPKPLTEVVREMEELYQELTSRFPLKGVAHA
jgi:glycosyltransferase involved in cell wall biosynthesis